MDQPELELFPCYLLFLRQQPATRPPQSNIWLNMGMTSLRMFPEHVPRGNVSPQQEGGPGHLPHRRAPLPPAAPALAAVKPGAPNHLNLLLTEPAKQIALDL